MTMLKIELSPAELRHTMNALTREIANMNKRCDKMQMGENRLRTTREIIELNAVLHIMRSAYVDSVKV